MKSLLALTRRALSRFRLAKAPSVKRVGRDVHVGKGVRLWAPESITIGSHCYIGKEVTIETNAEIGSFVLIANRVGLVGRHDHDFSEVGVPVRFGKWIGAVRNPSRFRAEAVVVQDDVWIGYGATVLSGVTIGRGAIVAAGSVVTKSIAPYCIVGGNPARILGERLPQHEVALHEARIRSGRFGAYELPYDDWIIEPGPSND